jgi:uracil-DNA glycosylase family 4
MSLLGDLLGNQLKVLQPKGGCHTCPRKRAGFVPPDRRQTQMILVGDLPSKADQAAGYPLAGESGQLLRSLLAAEGIVDVSSTFLVHCAGMHKEPSEKEIGSCLSQFVLEEVRGYSIVVLLGPTVARSFFPGADFDKLRGNVSYHPDFPGQRFYVMMHPAFATADGEAGEKRKRILQKHVQRLGRVARGEPQKFNVVTDDSAGFLMQMRECLAQRRVSLDIECNRLESWARDPILKSFAVTADGKSVYFVHKDSPNWQAALNLLRGFLEDPTKQVVGMNIGFDLVWLESQLGFTVRTPWIHDVGVLYYQIKSYQQWSLKELVSEELDGYRYLVYEPHKERDMWLLGMYNAEDVVYAWDLLEIGLATLRKPGYEKTLDLYLRVAGPSSLALQRVTHDGIFFRVDQWRQNGEDLEAKRREILRQWKEIDPAFIPTQHESGKGLQKYLFEIHGLEPVYDKRKEGGKGEPSVDERVIKEYIRQGATYLQPLLDLRKTEKQLSTYIRPYEALIAPDGRIHPGYNNTRTDTGRLSSVRPNFQNIPRLKNIRAMFGSAPGCTIVQGDFSQIELRIAMSLARDPVGIAAYVGGSDLHSQTASSFCAGEYPTKEERTYAKAINFALIYGGTEFTLMDYAKNTYGVEFSLKQARDFHAAFFATYPLLQPWHETCNRELVENRGNFVSAVGHRFYYRNWNHPHEPTRDADMRSHTNSRAQGPAGYMAIYTLILAQRMMLEADLPARIVGTVHDSIMTEVEKGKEDRVMEIKQQAVDQVASWCRDWFLTPLVMDFEVGESWGTLQEVKKAA